MEEKLTQILERMDKMESAFSDRMRKIEDSLQADNTSEAEDPEDTEEVSSFTGFSTLARQSDSGPQGGGSSELNASFRRRDGPVAPRSKKERPTTIRSKDLKWEYEALRDTVSRLKLPADYRMNDSKSGISSKDKEQAAILVRSGKYIETGLKLMGEVQKNWNQREMVAELLDGVLLSLTAHMRYIQEEHGSLYVGGQYGMQTKNIYRTMQRCTSNLTSEDIETLKTAVSITPMPVQGVPQSQPGQRGGFRQNNWRGRGQFRGGSRGFRGNNFNNFGYQPRGIPNYREQGNLPSVNESEEQN